MGSDAKFSRFSQILSIIGSIIIFLGISTLIYQHFNTLSYSMKVSTTLGLGIITYIIAALLHKFSKWLHVSTAFFLIALLTLPIGLGVIFNHLGLDINHFDTQSIFLNILLIIAVVSYFCFRTNLFMLATILFATYFFFSITDYLIPLHTNIFSQYQILIVGLIYILLGNIFTRTKLAALSGFLYGVGSIAFLGAALGLGGWKPHQNLCWELAFPFLAFGSIFSSIPLKSKSLLVFGSIFLMLYIVKISHEYFANSLGWPFTLVIIGFVLIGISSLFLWVRKKYLA